MSCSVENGKLETDTLTWRHKFGYFLLASSTKIYFHSILNYCINMADIQMWLKVCLNSKSQFIIYMEVIITIYTIAKTCHDIYWH